MAYRLPFCPESAQSPAYESVRKKYWNNREKAVQLTILSQDVIKTFIEEFII